MALAPLVPVEVCCCLELPLLLLDFMFWTKAVLCSELSEVVCVGAAVVVWAAAWLAELLDLSVPLEVDVDFDEDELAEEMEELEELDELEELEELEELDEEVEFLPFSGSSPDPSSEYKKPSLSVMATSSLRKLSSLVNW